MAPDFLIAGMTKSGSTSLNQLLRKHHQIAIPRGEVHFFDRNFSQGLSYYENRLMKDCPDTSGKLLGDTTPGYAKSAETAKRISQTVPDVKLVFCLRNPCDRLFSTYLHGYKKGKRQQSFEDFVEKRTNRDQADCEPFVKTHYDLMLEPYRELFPVENILIVLFEDLVGENQVREINRLTDFLAVERFANPELPWKNKTSIPVGLSAFQGLRRLPVLRRLSDKASWLLPASQPNPSMAPQTRKMLEMHFAPLADRLDSIWGTSARSLWNLNSD